MKNKYKIGEAARILGISPDLLRYYERKGVVSPEKDPDNDYRYYDFWDINFLMDCLWFKNFGFSIEQIADIVHIPSVTELDAMLLEKEDELRRTLKRCELLLRRSGEHRCDLQRIDRLLYQIEIAPSPEFIRFINRVGDSYMMKEGLKPMAESWLKVLPFNRRYFEINTDKAFPATEEDCRWGFCLSRDYAEALDFEVRPPMALIPSRKSIHTIFQNADGRGGFAPGLLQYAADYAAQHGLKIHGPVCGVLLASVMEESGFTGYFEAWIPIE